MAKKAYGKELVANERRFIHEKRTDVPAGVTGRYRIGRRGVLLMDLDGTPFGFICSNDDDGRAGRGPGFLVTAFVCNGRVRYTHGATKQTSAKLGLTDTSHAHVRAMCASVLQQAAA